MKIISQSDSLSNLFRIFLLVSSHSAYTDFPEFANCPSAKLVPRIQRFLQNYYDELVDQLDLTRIEDPDHPGSFIEYRIFASYTRTVILPELDDAVIHLRIQRIRPCNAPGPSHALLPSFLVPWRRFPLPVLICLVKLLSECGGNVSKAARKAAVWPGQLCQLRNGFDEVQTLTRISLDSEDLFLRLTTFIRTRRRTWFQSHRSFRGRKLYADLIMV